MKKRLADFGKGFKFDCQNLSMADVSDGGSPLLSAMGGSTGMNVVGDNGGSTGTVGDGDAGSGGDGGAGQSCNEIMQPLRDDLYSKLQNSPLKDQDQDCYAQMLLEFNNLLQNARETLAKAGQCSADPLVLDLDGNGIYVSTPEQGVDFDLLGRGSKVRTAWIDRGDALLALDRNSNGLVDGAIEIFGNVAGGRSFCDGFAALGELDHNHDGRIDRRDAAFAKLRLWRDANRDGRTGPGELQSLRAAKIRALELQPVRLEGDAALAPNGNKIPLVSRFVRTDGRRGLLGDVYFRFQTAWTGR